MREADWRNERDSRSIRYAGRVLDPDRWIVLSAAREYATRYDGQVAIQTAANLLGRMSPAIGLDIPEVSIAPPLAESEEPLTEYLIRSMYEADPYGRFARRQYRNGDYVIRLGRSGANHVVHGSGWSAYLGPSPSPLIDDNSINPIGPAMAAIIAASEAFRMDLAEPFPRTLVNCLNWELGIENQSHEVISPTQLGLGNLWVVGAGSVGTSILYFLSLTTRKFHTTIFDHDIVKVHNLDRSPIFINADVTQKKADISKRWLNTRGISASAEPNALHESETWNERQESMPDILISAANEFKVRSVIESRLPPLQIYGTTGNNWQAALLRHIPLRDPCSRCLFFEDKLTPTQCATGSIGKPDEENIDAALPFLSFAAGAMAAAEILKLGLTGYPFSSNRVILNTGVSPQLVSARLVFREQCICTQRSNNLHRRMIKGSRYADLSNQRN